MRTEPPAAPPRGFTLIEVLVAMVLLAIGLLGLQALSVSAVGATGLGERNSRAAMLATASLETAVEEIQRGQSPAQLCVDVEGDRVSRAIDITPPNSPLRPKITVVVQPRGAPPRPFTVSSYAFAPAPIATTSGEPCA